MFLDKKTEHFKDANSFQINVKIQDKFYQTFVIFITFRKSIKIT